jgi:DNA mismatch endonuclease (patch repair protein)
VDTFDEATRSAIMRRIRSSGTAIEDRLYEIIRDVLGPRWRIDRNVRILPGKPDVLIPSLRVAIFSDGCFYHCCPLHGHVPKSNTDYWRPKLERNRRRDRRAAHLLRAMGYAVWRFWSHELSSRVATERTRQKLACRLARRREKV